MRPFDAELIVDAYCQGFFPMGDDEGTIRWYSPDPRGILPVEHFQIPRSIAKEVSKMEVEIRVNASFEEVMKACGNRKDTWISAKILKQYTRLHQLGLAHSVETWQDGELIGGLYGVSIRGAFFGESMFSRKTNASKAALLWLLNHLKRKGFILHDTQWTTPHLARFGGHEIKRDLYLTQLERALEQDVWFAGD